MSNPYRAALFGLALAVAAAPSSVASTGGVEAPGPPRVTEVSCVGSPSCRARRTVLRGLEFIVRGHGLRTVRRVLFAGRRGRRDDVIASTTRRDARYAAGRVPAKALSGPMVLLGVTGDPLVRVAFVRVRRAPKAGPIEIGPRKSFFVGGRRATFSFDVSRATETRVDLVNEDTQSIVRSWSVRAEPGRRATVSWDGRVGGRVQPQGRYGFRLGGAGASSATAAPGSATSFFFAGHVFPIRGPHNLGYTDTNSFGGGGKRKHLGQDMFARCGARLAAARGGEVQYAGYHAAAGNYLVIDGIETGTDYVYMHLRRPPLVRTGDRVLTGQMIGEVGETGRATGCHLHFELWRSPGWYEGGRAFDPLPSLRRWDVYS